MSEYITIKRTELEQALAALRFYAEESHHVTLTGFKNGKRIDWDQERDRLEKAGYRFSHENHNSTEEYVEDGRRARNALNNLEEALAQQAEPVQEPITRLFGTLPVHDAQQAPPMSEQKRKDGKYKVLYRCQDCGHDQWITEIVAHGATYTGGSANWCDACDNGLPVRVDPMQQSEPVYYEVSSGVTHNLWMRVSKSQYDEYIRSGWAGRTLHALTQQNITDSNKDT